MDRIKSIIARIPASGALDELQDEIQCLIRDASRYRALRDAENQLLEDDICVSDPSFNAYFGDDLDAAVDILIARNRDGRNPWKDDADAQSNPASAGDPGGF